MQNRTSDPKVSVRHEQGSARSTASGAGQAKEPRGADRPRPAYPIESVDNVLRLLLLLRERGSLRVAEAARMIGVVPSTVHRLLAMLQYYDFVSQDSETKLYSTGPALIDMGFSALRKLDLRVISRPHLQALGEEVEETVHICELRSSDVLFLDSIESPRQLRVAARTGTTLPAHVTASGKVLLAHLSPAELRSLYPRAELPAVTVRSIRRRSDLERALQQVRRAGFALNDGESEDGIGAAAVPIFSRSGQARGAVSVSVPLTRFDEAGTPELVETLRRCADNIQADLP